MTLQISQSRTVFCGGPGYLERRRLEFERQHCVLLPQLLEPALLQFLQRELANAEFYETVHRDTTPPAVDLCMKHNRAAALLCLLMNDPVLFDLVERITGCERIGYFEGSVYRMVPGGRQYDSWHDDVVDGRMVAMSVNLSPDVFQGGALQIRERESRRIVHEVANTGFGDGILFRLDSNLQHCVRNLEGAVARTAYAGWFKSQPRFISILHGINPEVIQERR